MKHLIPLLLLAFLLPVTATGHDFEVDGIYYNINGNEASVTYRGSDSYQYSNEYTGEVTIPAIVTYNGMTYPVTSIGYGAFDGCIEITSVTIPNSVTSIGDEAFYYCIGLTNINIPNSVIAIGSWTFGCCSGLTSITVDNNNPIYDSRDNCNAIIESSSNTLMRGCMNTVIPNSVTSIDGWAFFGCSGLNSINIPNSVTSIGESAFLGCTGLTSINIPNSVTSIGEGAFDGCTGLDTVYSYINDPSLVSIYGAFYRYPENYTTRILYVPYGTSGAYQAIDNWSRYFGNIIEMVPEVPVSLITLDMTVASMTLGETLQLTATIMPEDATCKTVNWTSSDTNVAIVDANGHVTALAPGSATITATTTDGTNLSASCAITVEFGIVENYLTINNITVRRGETVVIPVAMTNEASITSFQTDIFLPEGIELLQEDGEYLIDPSNRMTRTHSIISEATDNDAIHVLCYSPSNKAFTGNSGEDLFYMTVKVADDAEGDYTITLRNTRLTTTDDEELLAPDTEAIIKVKANEPGDVKEDGMINVADVSALIQYLLTGNSSLINLDNADVNGDGLVIINDIAALINMLLAPGR